ncbi:MAG: SDR family NAD(P)-dependent oxidoreductase [Bacteroidales bacterium]|uniref:SDR family NAD(P)-dependent oxidoreductase n=1 Tax=Candidatus Cryptobacteroides sp. TaxID=2952915 RepID=UPI002A75DA4D|nr:SDR family NAD(P)-dependent oxidoreductase [Candidatus Cryptobacteroides sp.]MCI6527212.1 SDR family NAD(P)-dependent oxidoreductase [Bacteroidales bacterium]MDD7135737.1 SDR family NAD(P)-dependent oxidoreductase [Bacteroidales bacterium]MDD7233871.1 SDR family NAD(P)-dependent oxidoreductase [Bacteroidales bacterium]MDD7623160.1 SDR family NAD(P)-dependent oxidoreductase [Bacteroidales bacterium]MDY2701696.1 SDR family NAD(P)-dependent oxidoreductase [Candidatus Cryptobacteroides sp.]
MMALVTGGSSGIGLEFSRQLAAKGYDLIIVSNSREQLDAVCAPIAEEYGVRVIPRLQNLATGNAAEELMEWCDSQSVLPDILINNAGMFYFKELSPELMGKAEVMIGLHVTTPTKMCILFGDRMKQRGSGRILLVASMAARIPAPGIQVYSATKAYLRSFGESLSFELKPYGVTVTTLCPAAVATPLYGLKKGLLNFGVAIRVIHTPQWLVRKALKGLFRGRRLMKPSIMNAYLPPMIKMLPSNLEQKIWDRIKVKL